MRTDNDSKRHMMTMIGRGLLAAGGILLIVKKIRDASNSKSSWPMIAMGAASTVPLAIGVVQNIKEARNAMV